LDHDFTEYLKDFPNVIHYKIELAFGDQEFVTTSIDNPNHMQLRTNTILWYKENLLEILRKSKLPKDCKFAWMDADITFSNVNIINDTLSALNENSIVHMFDKKINLGPDEEELNSSTGSIAKYINTSNFGGASGLAWAANNEFINAIGGLIDWCIIGSADWCMSAAMLDCLSELEYDKYNEYTKPLLDAWHAKLQENDIGVGYVHGICYHHFHGHKKDRGYDWRHNILMKHEFDTSNDLLYLDNGLLDISVKKMELRNELREYFHSRQEDNDVENILHVVTTVFNPSGYNSRYFLYNQFKRYMAKFKNVVLYTVELTIGDQHHVVTDNYNPRHLQLHTNNVLWYKENLINEGIKKLIPASAKNIAYFDADMAYYDDNWPMYIVDKLKECDVVQCWSSLDFLDENYNVYKTRNSFMSDYMSGLRPSLDNPLGPPGLAWAMTREAYDKIGRIYDKNIVGANDRDFCHILVNEHYRMPETLNGYDELMRYNNIVRAANLSYGYVDLVAMHYFHGHTKDRGYGVRDSILNDIDISQDLSYDENGLLQIVNNKDHIYLKLKKYFDSRNEDVGHVVKDAAAE